MTKTVDEIIDEYCKDTRYVIGAGRSSVARFAEWFISKNEAENERQAVTIKNLREALSVLAVYKNYIHDGQLKDEFGGQHPSDYAAEALIRTKE